MNNEYRRSVRLFKSYPLDPQIEETKRKRSNSSPLFQSCIIISAFPSFFLSSFFSRKRKKKIYIYIYVHRRANATIGREKSSTLTVNYTGYNIQSHSWYIREHPTKAHNKRRLGKEFSITWDTRAQRKLHFVI